MTFSGSDQRAEGRDVDRLAAIDAGLNGEQQRARLGQLGGAGIQLFQLRGDEPPEIDAASGEHPADRGQRKAGPLQRHDGVQPRQLAGPIEPASRAGAQRPDQPARLVEAQRARRQPGAPGHLRYVDRVHRESL